jgi:hypothetical protein
LEKSVLTAHFHEHRYIGTEHLLFALLDVPIESLASFFRAQNVSPIVLRGQVEIGEVSESGMTLTVPANACAVGHLLTLQIHRNGKAEPEILLTAKVTEAEPLGAAREGIKLKAITLKFYQLDEIAWRKFLVEFSERQRRTQTQLEIVRGE